MLPTRPRRPAPAFAEGVLPTGSKGLTCTLVGHVTDMVLVTGGAGFLGSHVCRRLLESGSRVLCLDNFLTGRRSNVEALTEDPRFRLVEHDLREPLPPFEESISTVMHLASPASPTAYQANPIETLEVGSVGTLHVLELARRLDADLLLASTSEVYGDPEVSPQPESYRGNVSPTGPRSMYDEAKRFSEAATMAFHRAHGLRTRIARIFNCYGPGMSARDGRAIPDFIRRALDGEPVVVFGDGSQTRSFCYVDDLVDGLLALLRSDESEPVNIGNPDERSLLEVARSVVSLSGSDSPITFEALPEDDPRSRRPDITRARTILGWEPRVELEEGLTRTIAWFRETRSAASSDREARPDTGAGAG
jgi:dTDP-glucose 4,6-dehydratase